MSVFHSASGLTGLPRTQRQMLHLLPFFLNLSKFPIVDLSPMTGCLVGEAHNNSGDLGVDNQAGPAQKPQLLPKIHLHK